MALNREYLQSQIASADPEDHKSSVKFATTGSIPAYNRSGNVITAVANGAFPSHDGETPVQGDEILFWHGVSDTDNGIYTITQLGNGSNPFILTRRSDADTNEFVTSGMRVPISAGVLYGGQEFVLMTPDPIVLNTTGLVFEPREVGGGASPVIIDGETEGVLENKRIVYTDDIQIEDDGDFAVEGDVASSDSFDNYMISKVPTRQSKVIHQFQTMLIAPDLVVDGELVIDGDLIDFPEVQVSSSNVLEALDSVLSTQELLGKYNSVGGVTSSQVRDWTNVVGSGSYVSHEKTGKVISYAFVDDGEDTAPWIKAEVASVNADDSYEGIVIRGLYVDVLADGFVAKKLIVNSGNDGTITFIDEEEAAADPTSYYRIVLPSESGGGNFVLAPKEACWVFYDRSKNRWVVSAINSSPREYNSFVMGSYPTYPASTELADLQSWIVAEYGSLYPPAGNVTIHGLSHGRYFGSLDTYSPARKVKFLINRTTTSNTVTFKHNGTPGDSSEVIYTDTGSDIVLGKDEIAICMYISVQSRWHVAKFAGLHASSHENGGGDEISVAGLSGLLADNQNPVAHASSHENGGGDEIDVNGLSGVLADQQIPMDHASSHENGGGDEISVAGLSGLLADDQNPVAHASSHENGGADEISVAGLSGLLADNQNPVAHASSHEDGGGDEISVAGLSGVLADAQTPAAHDFGGSAHNADTISDINTKVSDATLFGSAYGEMYQDDNATATTLSAEPTFTRLAGTYSSGLLSGFSLANGSGGSAGALQYTGSLTKVFQVVVQISGGASSADTIVFRIAVNGTTLSKSEARRYMSGSNDEGVAIVTALVSLAQNDYVEIFAARVGGSANVTVDEMNVNIVAVG